MENDLSFNFLCIFCINFGGKTLQICTFLSLRDTWYLYFEVKTEKYMQNYNTGSPQLTRFSCCQKFILGELWKLKNLVGNVISYKKFHINAQNSLNMNLQEHENCVMSEDLLYILDMCARNHYARQTYDMSKYACTCEKSIVVDCEMMMRVWRMICRYS